jgi:antitoxin HigA-1
MAMKKLPNIHPGEILDKEFLAPLNITAYRLSREIKIPQTRISEIIKGKRRITADTALRLSKYFGNSPQFWLGLQNDYDLEEETNVLRTELKKIHSFNALTDFHEKRAAMA